MSNEWTQPAGPSGPAPGGGAGPSGPRASFGERLIAGIIDGVILGVFGAVVSLIIGANAGRGLGVLIGFAYFGYLEGSLSGQTIGKRVMNIRVIDFQTGGQLGVGKALLRHLMRYVSACVCLVGFFWMLWDKERQTWHDKVAGAVVVPTSAYPVDAWPG
ncbi:MAG TPA: RDD family protein [Acidimicrobiales bacterium]|jgi:uncharacterized RDD family membrane protein YckC|nr:RDD family protein [Acidimicrobiales bacterium]